MVVAPVDDQMPDQMHASGSDDYPRPGSNKGQSRSQDQRQRAGKSHGDFERATSGPEAMAHTAPPKPQKSNQSEPWCERQPKVADGDLCLPIPSFRERAGLRGPATLQLPDAEGQRQRLMVSIQEIMLALEQCEDASDYRGLQARALLGEALERRLAELRALDAQIARATLAPQPKA